MGKGGWSNYVGHFFKGKCVGGPRIYLPFAFLPLLLSPLPIPLTISLFLSPSLSIPLFHNSMGGGGVSAHGGNNPPTPAPLR